MGWLFPPGPSRQVIPGLRSSPWLWQPSASNWGRLSYHCRAANPGNWRARWSRSIISRTGVSFRVLEADQAPDTRTGVAQKVPLTGNTGLCLTRRWSGEPCHFEGNSYQAHEACFLPTPVQSPHNPHPGCGGLSPYVLLRRAARFAGVVPMAADHTLLDVRERIRRRPPLLWRWVVQLPASLRWQKE